MKLSSHREAQCGFTLVELIVVVATIALLAAIALPGLKRARMRSQATKVKNDLRLIDNAVALYAIENHKKGGDLVYVDDWAEYIKVDSPLYLTGQDIFGRDYADQIVDRTPTVPAATYDMLLGAVEADFWLPYVRETVPQPATKKKKKKK